LACECECEWSWEQLTCADQILSTVARRNSLPCHLEPELDGDGASGTFSTRTTVTTRSSLVGPSLLTAPQTSHGALCTLQRSPVFFPPTLTLPWCQPRLVFLCSTSGSPAPPYTICSGSSLGKWGLHPSAWLTSPAIFLM
jgi:hypothetical protein